MTTKIKIGFDDVKQNLLLSAVNEAVKLINSKLTPALSEIGFELTEGTFADCFAGGTAIKEKYYSSVNQDINNVSGKGFKNLLKQTAQKDWQKFSNILVEVVGQIKADVLGYVSVIDGLAVLPDEAKAAITEVCTLYISSDAEIARYKLYLEVIDALNAFFDNNCLYDWHRLFEPVSGIFEPKVLDYKFINTKINQLKTN